MTKVTEQAARMDGFLQRNNLRDMKTNLHLSPAYENNGKISERFGKLLENTNLVSPT